MDTGFHCKAGPLVCIILQCRNISDTSALLVRGCDEAISYFVEKLGFAVAEGTDLGGGKRWVLVAPPRSRHHMTDAAAQLETKYMFIDAQVLSEKSSIGDQNPFCE